MKFGRSTDVRISPFKVSLHYLTDADRSKMLLTSHEKVNAVIWYWVGMGLGENVEVF